MGIHKEIHLEDEICGYLGGHGWLYAGHDAADYDRARALFPPDLLARAQETEPKAWGRRSPRTMAPRRPRFCSTGSVTSSIIAVQDCIAHRMS